METKKVIKIVVGIILLLLTAVLLCSWTRNGNPYNIIQEYDPTGEQEEPYQMVWIREKRTSKGIEIKRVYYVPIGEDGELIRPGDGGYSTIEEARQISRETGSRVAVFYKGKRQMTEDVFSSKK